MDSLTVVAMGALPPRLAEDLCPFLARAGGIPCRFGGKGPDPSFALLAERGQLEARALLAALEGHASRETRVLGIVDADLCAKVFTFVFGEAVLGGRAAVVSLHRLRPERYGLPPQRALVRDRLRRVALHETGHLLGLVHCRRPECVMRFSGSVEELDLKEDAICSPCRELLTHPLDNFRAPRPGVAGPAASPD